MAITDAQRRASERAKAKKKAAGVCVDCTALATRGLRCDVHADAVMLRTAERNARRDGRGDRIPTFEDFERLERER